MKTKVFISAILGIGLNVLLLGSCTGPSSYSEGGTDYYPVTTFTYSSTLPSRISHSTVNIPNSLPTPAESATLSKISIPTADSWKNPAMQTLESCQPRTLLSSPVSYSRLSELDNLATTSTPMTSTRHSAYSNLKPLATSGVLSAAVSRHPQPQVLSKPAVLHSNEGFQTSLLDKPLMKVEKRIVLP